MRRTLSEIKRRAGLELISNTSITKYIYISGVEFRSPGHPIHRNVLIPAAEAALAELGKKYRGAL